ncbi:rhomboid family intramembrane serine protease, partial [Candidatus Sumerlaeota bacterium]|nr:rhomboid family intramembrane serine protease [Candidatus Sumerlaeota bacterium]
MKKLASIRAIAGQRRQLGDQLPNGRGAAVFPFFCFVLFPYANEKRRERFPLATILIIALNIAAFVWEASLWRAGQTSVIKQFAFTPGESPWHTMLTANFLHGGPLHLAFNLWFLWLIAGQVEERMGSPLFAVFYLASGLFTALGHALYSHMVGLPIGAMGASGCVYAVLGAYFVLYPFEDFRFWYFFIMRWGTIKIATFFYVLYALVTGLLSAYADVLNVAGTHVGNWAHMGGLLFGLIVGFAAFGAGPFTGEENPGQKRTRAERRLRRIARRKFYSDASLPEPMTEQEFAAATEDITPPEAVQRGLFFHNGRMI